MENNLSNAEFIKRNIWLDCGSEPWYGDDQVYISYPCHFETVSFYLQSSDGLIALADREREAAGFLPMMPTEKHPEDYDDDGWYDFYLEINGFADDHLGQCIEAIVCSDYAEDNGELYIIDIPNDARQLLYDRLDAQARAVFDMSCEEMLRESKEYLLESERMSI